MSEVDSAIRGLMAFLECNSRKCDGCEYQDKKPGMPGGCKLDQYQVIDDAVRLLSEQEKQIKRLEKENAELENVMRIEKGLNICTSAEPCNGCPYLGKRNCSLAMVRDALDLLKEQEQREKRIFKGVCDFIRSGISTDTDIDQDYVCNEIQKIFCSFWKGGETDA